MRISMMHMGHRRFESGSGDSRVVMDAREGSGGLGRAPTPKKMVLYALAGCTGMDVAAILERKRVPFDGLAVEVEAEETGTHPQVFKRIAVTYRVDARPEHLPAIERAVLLSEKTFCGVSAMLRKTAEMTREIALGPLD